MSVDAKVFHNINDVKTVCQLVFGKITGKILSTDSTGAFLRLKNLSIWKYLFHHANILAVVRHLVGYKSITRTNPALPS